MSLDLDALETSFDLVAPRGQELVDEFYARLFETAPAVKPLFAHTDFKRQKAILLATLVLLRKPEHYPVVGEVLIGAMATIAGPAWKPEYEAAWAKAFGIVAGAMIEGAEAAQLDAAA
jgi:hemoglobin-like flavoprotein